MIALHERQCTTQSSNHERTQSHSQQTWDRLASGSLERRTVLWVRGNDSRSIIHGDLKCWRKLSLGDLRICSRLQLRTCLDRLRMCTSSEHRSRSGTHVDTAISSKDTQYLAVGASVGPHSTKPRTKPQRPTSSLGNASTPGSLVVSSRKARLSISGCG